MKKILTMLAAGAATVLLAACTTMPTVNTATVTGMTAEKAAGTYHLAESFEMGQIKAADFSENTLMLTGDGKYTLTVTLADGGTTTESGAYTVSDNGAVTLADGGTVAMDGETVIADGEKITVSKSGMGTQAKIEMIYEREKTAD